MAFGLNTIASIIAVVFAGQLITEFTCELAETGTGAIVT